MLYMAYNYKSKFGRKRYAAKKKGVSRLVKGKQTKIQTLAKAIKNLQLQNKKKKIILNYTQTYNQGVSSDYTVFYLSKISSWNPTFGTSSDDGTANSMIHKSMGIDMYLSLENTTNEPDTTGFTMFLVSLKDDAQAGCFDPASGNLAMLPGQHYVTINGLTLLNKKVFNIHAIRRKVLTNHGTALSGPSAQTQSGTDYRHYFKLRVNKKIVSPIGNWSALSCPADPSKNYFLIVFNDNSTLDLQNPKVTMNIVHSVEQLA